MEWGILGIIAISMFVFFPLAFLMTWGIKAHFFPPRDWKEYVHVFVTREEFAAAMDKIESLDKYVHETSHETKTFLGTIAAKQETLILLFTRETDKNTNQKA